MPIINKRNSAAQQNNAGEAKVTSGPSPGYQNPAPAYAPGIPSSSGPSKNTVIYSSVAGIFLIAAAFGIYHLFGKNIYVEFDAPSSQIPEPETIAGEAVAPSTPAPVPEATVDIDVEDLNLNIDRYIKLGSIAALTKQEIEVNIITLIEAENTGSTVTMHAVEVILDKKKKEVFDLEQKMAEVLSSVYEYQQLNADQVTSVFNQRIENANLDAKTTEVSLLTVALDAVSTVPPIVAPMKHFSSMIKDRL